MKLECPCCHSLTLENQGADEICPVCFWRDDGQDDPHADEIWGGANYELSLTTARANYKRFGASCERVRQFVRPPDLSELAK